MGTMAGCRVIASGTLQEGITTLRKGTTAEKTTAADNTQCLVAADILRRKD
jgi:hypothetical protein